MLAWPGDRGYGHMAEIFEAEDALMASCLGDGQAAFTFSITKATPCPDPTQTPRTP